MQITDQLRHEWNMHPVTRELLDKLQEAIQDAKDAWANQEYPNELANAAALGGIESVKSVINTIEGYFIKELDQ